MSDERNDLPVPQEPNGRDDLLDRATAALRAVRVPDGPPADVLGRTLQSLGVNTPGDDRAAVEGAPRTPDRLILHPNSERSVIPMRKLLRYAAAAVIAVVAAGVVLWAALQYGSRPALADVLKQIRDVKAVTFKVTTKVNIPTAGPQQVTADVLLTEAGQMRQTIAKPMEMVTVMDLRSGKAVTLIPSQKQAVTIELANMDPSQMPPNCLEDLKKLNARDATPVGEKEIGGRMFSGYKALKDGQEMTIWVDPGTRLPVQIDVKMNTPVMPSVEATMTDFVWNAQVDPSQLSVTPPPGYEVMPLKMNMAASTEKDLTAALRTAAELNGGTFPDGIDMAGLTEVLAGMKDRLPKDKNSAEFKEFQAKAGQTMLTIGRGWMFMGDAKNGSDFRYAGQGAKLGEKGRAVLWYKPKDSETYRVIDADLTVHDGVKADELPNLPSKAIEAPAMGATGGTVQPKE